MAFDLLISIVLLAVFIVGVNSIGAEDPHVGNRLAALFASGAALAWPTGVQEDDEPLWVTARERQVEPNGWPGSGEGAEIIDGLVHAVPVSRVRRIR